MNKQKIYTNVVLKVFLSDLEERKFRKWKWPYMDVFFYCQNETHLWYLRNWFIPLESVFPLQLRPLGKGTPGSFFLLPVLNRACSKMKSVQWGFSFTKWHVFLTTRHFFFLFESKSLYQYRI